VTAAQKAADALRHPYIEATALQPIAWPGLFPRRGRVDRDRFPTEVDSRRQTRIDASPPKRAVI
jgi:hypothetical protein